MIKFLFAGAAAAVFAAAAFAQPAPPTPPGVAQGTTPPPVPGVPQVRIETRMHRMPMMMPETRNEVVAHIREMFAKLDTNRDGFVTREEADSAHKNMGGEFREKFVERHDRPGMPHLDHKAMFDRLDTNHDGMISRQEFDAHAQVREERRVVMMHGGPDGTPGMPPMPDMKRFHDMGARMHGHMFEMADANHDGKVSLQEMTAAALRHFDMADANHDGRITPDERMQMHQRMKEMKRPA